MNVNDKIYINNFDGTYTPALFKGYLDNDCCLVKPQERYLKSGYVGYGITITALVKNIVTEEQIIAE
jgi:hypothetical protein